MKLALTCFLYRIDLVITENITVKHIAVILPSSELTEFLLTQDDKFTRTITDTLFIGICIERERSHKNMNLLKTYKTHSYTD